MIALASVVPPKEMLVVVDTAPLLGEVIAGAEGAVVSGGGLGLAGIVDGVDWLVVFSDGGAGFVTPPPPPPRMPMVGMMVNVGAELFCPVATLARAWFCTADAVADASAPAAAVAVPAVPPEDCALPVVSMPLCVCVADVSVA